MMTRSTQHNRKPALLSLLVILLLTLASRVYAAEKIKIDDESFGVIYETPMNTIKGLILYINNNKCVGSYRIANNDFVVANGEINARGPNKHIILGTARFNIDCGPSQSLVLNRE